MIVIGFMTQIGHTVKVSLMIGIIRILEAEATLKVIEIVVTETILVIEKGHMTEADVEIETMEENLTEIEVGKIQDPEVEEDQPLETKVKTGGVTITKNQYILREC